MEPGAKLAYVIESAHGWCIGEYAHSVARRQPESVAAVLPINTGRCICTNSGPFSFAVGLAMGSPITLDEFCEVEKFFHNRGLLPRIDITPYTDPSLTRLLSERRYFPSEFTSMLCANLNDELPAVSCSSDIVLRWAEGDDCGVWADVIEKCFFGSEPEPERRENLAAMFHVPNSLNLIALVGGEVAGVSGGMIPDDRSVPTLFGSAVLPSFRRRGIHAAMLRFRLERARDAGCKVAAVSATPGSASERNLLRLGFTPCYEKVTYRAGK